MNNDRNLENRLINIGRELKDLKTTHLHGLGLFDFYQEKVSYTNTQRVEHLKLSINFDANGQFPPFAQIHIANGEYIYKESVNLNSNSHIMVIHFQTVQIRTFTFFVTSAVKVTNLQIEEVV